MVIVQDYDSPDEVLHQKQFEELKKCASLMYDYIDVSFRHNGSSSNVVMSCLVDAMEDLRDFHSKNQR